MRPAPGTWPEIRERSDSYGPPAVTGGRAILRVWRLNHQECAQVGAEVKHQPEASDQVQH